MATDPGRLKLIVGIDYGTTYSGLSFALSNATDFRDILPWTKYPGSFSHVAEHNVKAPTRIAFRDDNSDLDSNCWGYQVYSGLRMYRYTKLFLDLDALPSDYDDPDVYLLMGSEQVQKPMGRSPEQVASEYLKEMFKMFQQARLETLSQQGLDSLPADFWLTVPASWSEKAKLKTKRAAINAGFGRGNSDRVMLISEPEAAAHYALKSNSILLQGFVKSNTGVLVCDCGGGTVDMTSYEVVQIEPGLKLREIAVGATGKCGSTFVDRNLYKLLRDRFEDAFTSLPSHQIGPGSAFMDHFELHKKDFNGANPNRRPIRIPLCMPGLAITGDIAKYYEQRSSSVLLTFEDMRFIFDPVIDFIIRMIQDQVSQVNRKHETPIETLILVGGFGSSPYLKENVLDWCQRSSIRLTTPLSGAWSAVVCGAVLRGLESQVVQQRKCRRHYGYTVSQKYRPFLDQEYDRQTRYVWRDFEGDEDYLTGSMQWSIRKTIDKNTEMENSFFSISSNHLSRSGSEDLYSCSLDNAPLTIENGRIEKVGTIAWKLPKIEESEVPRFTRNGLTQFKLLLTLAVRLDDEAGHLVFRLLYKGEEIGKAEIDIERF